MLFELGNQTAGIMIAGAMRETAVTTAVLAASVLDQFWEDIVLGAKAMEVMNVTTKEEEDGQEEDSPGGW